MAHTPPHGDSGEQTRRRLLDSAELLFARQGFACTSVRDITRQARCNVAAVNYHFGGKLNLYREMFLSRMARVREQRLASIMAARQGAPETDALEHVLQVFASAFLEPLLDESHGRRLIELISRETLDPQLPPEMFHVEVFAPVRDALADAIGQTVPGLSEDAARKCVMSVVSQLIQLAHTVRHLQLAGTKEAARSELKTLIDHIVSFSAAGVRSCQRTET
jgi:TetR/AcrR family transcriptional regulator, regulator of cefoperazone and chloramphenicol sensitivity